jgi:hypothetical protein
MVAISSSKYSVISRNQLIFAFAGQTTNIFSAPDNKAAAIADFVFPKPISSDKIDLSLFNKNFIAVSWCGNKFLFFLFTLLTDSKSTSKSSYDSKNKSVSNCVFGI